MSIELILQTDQLDVFFSVIPVTILVKSDSRISEFIVFTLLLNDFEIAKIDVLLRDSFGETKAHCDGVKSKSHLSARILA